MREAVLERVVALSGGLILALLLVWGCSMPMEQMAIAAEFELRALVDNKVWQHRIQSRKNSWRVWRKALRNAMLRCLRDLLDARRNTRFVLRGGIACF